MGLDVYLHHYGDKAEADRLEAEYERRSNIIWDEEHTPYNSLSDAEKERRRRECRDQTETLGLNEYGRAKPPLKEDVRLKSAKYPEHLFEIGYFRSSYNAAGINHLLRTVLPEDRDLYWVFDHAFDGPSEFRPDWEKGLRRTQVLLEAFPKAAQYRVHTETVVRGDEDAPATAEAAQAIFDAELAAHRERRAAHPSAQGFNEYSSHRGLFMLGEEPMKARAVIKGRNRNFFAEPPVASMHVVLEKDGGHQIQTLSLSEPDVAVTDERAALDVFRAEQKRLQAAPADAPRDFFNRSGLFLLNGEALPIRALIHGPQAPQPPQEMNPCVYVVYEVENTAWYTQALEIVAETCEHVLAQADPGNYWLYWSS